MGKKSGPKSYSGTYLIAAQLGLEFAQSQPLFINRGVSGNRVSDLYARWNEDAFSLRPDLISILVGVNDAASIIHGRPEGATDRFERMYRQLLSETREVLPETGLVLCEPFVLKTGATTNEWDQWRSKIDEYSSILRQLADEYNTLFVPLQEVFNQAAQNVTAEYWLWDGVHPTAAGHQLITRAWLKIVQQSEYAIR